MTAAITLDDVLMTMWRFFTACRDEKVKISKPDFKALMIREGITQSEGTISAKWKTLRDLSFLTRVNQTDKYYVNRRVFEEYLDSRGLISKDRIRIDEPVALKV